MRKLLSTLLLGFATATHAEEFLVGADLSGLALMEERGAKYFDQGEERDALSIFKARGYNTIRLRLFLEADGRWGAVNDIQYTVKLAQRVKRHGFKLLLDLHYSDTWADPGHHPARQRVRGRRRKFLAAGDQAPCHVVD